MKDFRLKKYYFFLGSVQVNFALVVVFGFHGQASYAADSIYPYVDVSVSPNWTVKNGDTLTATRGLTFGRYSNGGFSKLTVDNGRFIGASYIVFGDDRVGSSSSTDIEVINGGVITSGWGVSFGTSTGASTNSKVLIDGQNSKITAVDTITIGRGNGSADAKVTGGGSVSAVYVSVGAYQGRESSGKSTVEVSGKDSQITASGKVSVGNADLLLKTDGTLKAPSVDVISDNSKVIVGDGASKGNFDVDNLNFSKNGTVIFDYSGDQDVRTEFAGKGTVEKKGSGATNFTGDNSSFGGLLKVTEGQANVFGSFGNSDSKIEVASYAALGGSGVINGDVSLSDDSVLAFSGDVKGALTSTEKSKIVVQSEDLTKVTSRQSDIKGELVLHADPVTNKSDVLESTGDINLGPASSLTINKYRAGQYRVGAKYELLKGEKINGKFGSVTVSELSRYLNASAIYTDTDFSVLLEKGDVTFADNARTKAQRRVATALWNTDTDSVLWNKYAELTDSVVASSALDSLSGEFYGSSIAAAFNESDVLRKIVVSRVNSVNSVGIADAAIESGIQETEYGKSGIWIAPYGARSKISAAEGGSAMRHSTSGVVIGADSQLADDWVVGALVGSGHANYSVSDRDSTGSGPIYHLGLYSQAELGQLSLMGGVAQTWTRTDVKRDIAFSGYSDKVSSHLNNSTSQIFGELVFNAFEGRTSISPFVNAAYVSVRQGAAKEKGGDARLNVSGSTHGVSYLTVGSYVKSKFQVGNVALDFDGKVGVRHAAGNLSPQASVGFSNTTSSYDIGGSELARDSVVVDLGVQYSPTNNGSIGVHYGATFGGGGVSNGLTAQYQYKF